MSEDGPDILRLFPIFFKMFTFVDKMLWVNYISDSVVFVKFLNKILTAQLNSTS